MKHNLWYALTQVFVAGRGPCSCVINLTCMPLQEYAVQSLRSERMHTRLILASQRGKQMCATVATFQTAALLQGGQGESYQHLQFPKEVKQPDDCPLQWSTPEQAEEQLRPLEGRLPEKWLRLIRQRTWEAACMDPNNIYTDGPKREPVDSRWLRVTHMTEEERANQNAQRIMVVTLMDGSLTVAPPKKFGLAANFNPRVQVRA